MCCDLARTTSFLQDLLLRLLSHIVWAYLEGKMMPFLPNELPYQNVIKEFIKLICLHAMQPIWSFLTGKIAGATRTWILVSIAPKMSYCFQKEPDEAIGRNPV